MKNGVVLIDIGKLKLHEAIDKRRLLELMAAIKNDGYLRNPIVVDQDSLVILDGHHRLEVLKALGYQKIPVFLVDYQSDQVKVFLRRKEMIMRLIKEAVIDRGENSQKFPHKTTRHLLPFRPRNINVRLRRLK